MENLLAALEASTNVKRLSYDNEKRLWLVEYKTDLTPSEIDSDSLIEFLTNAQSSTNLLIKKTKIV